MTRTLIKVPLVLLGVVALLAVCGRGTPFPEPGPNEDEGPELTDAELATIDAEMAAEIEKNLKARHVRTSADRFYLNLTMAERRMVTRLGTGLDHTKQGRDSGDKNDIDKIVEHAVTVTDVVQKVGNTATTVLGGLVKVGELAFEIGKELQRLQELKESKAGFLKGVLYEVQWQTEELCNVIAFNLNKKHKMGLTGLIYFTKYKYLRSWVGVWVAEGGYFENKAILSKDDKWGFAGSYNINGLFKNKVVFNHRPCYADVERPEDYDYY